MVTNVIKLVQGDTGPDLRATLTDETLGTAVDISDATVNLHFRERDGTTVLATLVGTILDGPTGQVIFEWGDTLLTIPEGDYEGELEVVFQDGMRQTDYGLHYFIVREDFA